MHIPIRSAQWLLEITDSQIKAARRAYTLCHVSFCWVSRASLGHEMHASVDITHDYLIRWNAETRPAAEPA